MRALCEQFYCPICRTDLPEVFFMENLEKFGAMPVRKFIINRKLKIQFENEAVREKFEKLLEHRCKFCPDRPADKSFKALRDHMRRQHTQFFCDLCVALKIFTSERKVYSRQDLASHRRVGDRDDTAYKGHPLCEFCDQRYLDKDELYKHLRKDHFYCHFCDVHGSQDYFSDYDVLRDHFRSQHYLCEEGECADVKFENAFRSQIDFKSHRATFHSKSLSKQQVKQERTINIDINLPPRTKPMRGRGGPGHHDDGARGRGHYDRGGRGGGRAREDRDLERAVQASLSTMKEENMKKDKTVTKKPEEVFKPTAESFPTLGGDAAPVPVTTANSTEVSSLAERFAMANMIPMNYHAQPNSLNDFPSLQQDSKPKSASNPNLAPKNIPTNNIGKTSYKLKMDGVRTEEDFPELTSGKKPVKAQPSGAWVKPGDNLHTSNPKTSNFNNNGKTSSMNRKTDTKKLKSKTVSDTNNLFHKVYDDADFPSLGKKTASNVQTSGWTQIGKSSPAHVTDNVSRPKTESDSHLSVHSKEETNTDLHSVIDRFSPVNVILDSADKKGNKAKNQKKKKKEKDKAPDLVNKTAEKVKKDESNSLKGNASLDNIASLLLGSSEQVSASSEWPSDTEKENIPSSHKTEEVTVKPSRPSLKTSTLETSEKVSFGDSKPVKFVIEDEFPSLGASEKVRKPPPGFIKSDEPKSMAPPGFSKPASKPPPPGFSANTQVKPDNDLAEYNLSTAMPLSAHLADFENFKYSQPKDFKERNVQLIGDIHAMLVDEQTKFLEFKTLSGEFRKRDIDAEAYFNGCIDILGQDNFSVIFPELLALLPDIDKQQELLEVYMRKEGLKKDDKDVINISRKSKNTKGAWTPTVSGFLTCQTCQQVLVRKDYNSHVSQHNLDADFPSLGMGSATTNTSMGYGAWVKAK